MSWKNNLPKNNIYYETDNGVLYCGDALDILPELDIQADLVLVDPPYNISNEVVISRGRNKMIFKGPDIVLSFGEWDKRSPKEFWKFTWKWIDLSVPLLRPGGMFISFFDRDKINFMSYFLQKRHNFKTKGYYAMLKLNPVPQARKVKTMNAWEIIGLWQKSDGKLTFNYQLGQTKDYSFHSIVPKKSKENGDRCHPTQKPIALMRKFISYWSNEQDIVIDPFAGSGTTLVACEKLNRRWIGIEINEEYCKKAKERIELEVKQLKLWR